MKRQPKKMACVSCARGKRSCSGDVPSCDRCQRLDRECVYDAADADDAASVVTVGCTASGKVK